MTERNVGPDVTKEYSFPQYGFADNPLHKGVSYRLGNITRESSLPGKDNPEERSLSLKVDRAELYQRFKKANNQQEKREILAEAHDLDRIYVDFLTKQQEVRVDMGGLGEQMSRYVILEPKVESTEPIIVLYPGISNDIENLGDLAIQLARKGRRVMIVGYPESWHGSATKEFGDAVKQSDNFGPHTEFFKKVVNQILGEDTLIDMMGVSTGSLIVANLVADKEFNKRINNATMIVPPGAVDHKFFDLDLGMEGFLSSFEGTKRLGRLSAKSRIMEKFTDEHRELMLHTFNALKEKVGQKYEWWKKDLTTGTGKKTTIIIGEKDLVTKAKKEKKAMRGNESLSVISFKEGNHSLPATKSKVLVDLINLVQEKRVA